ncbi:MAG: DUF2917 domain-containing protein [Prolixibacteraceae bacterium]|nr:DUF2917 domain-containing protein [Burkholderiales bacterium]
MKSNLQDCVLELLPAQVLRLHAAAGATIRCDVGILWVTQEGRAQDYFLSVGESLCIGADGLTLIEAMGGGAARLTLRASQASDRAIRMFRPRVSF